MFNGSNLNVYAMVRADSLSSSQVNVGGGANFGPVGAELSAESNQVFESTSKEGFTLVERGTAVTFYPEKQKKTAYVSIKPAEADDDGTCLPLCNAHPVPATKSGVIVTEDFYFKDAKKKWMDSENVSHRPENKPKDTNRLPSSGLKYLKGKRK